MDERLLKIAGKALLGFIREFSEDNWCASWYSGVEHIAYDAIQSWPDVPRRFDDQWNREALGNMKEVLDTTGLWCMWGDSSEPVVLPVKEYLEARNKP